MRPVILLVDSQIPAASYWARVLKACACEVVEVSSLIEFDRWASLGTPGLILLKISGADETLKAVFYMQQTCGSFPVVLVVREGSEELAVAAFRAGISDYFHLPGEEELLIATLQRLVASCSETIRCIPEAMDPEETFPFIGSSSPMQAVKSQVRRIAGSSSNVLITGETGTGKELVASAIHQMSQRSRHPFICVNCAAIPDALVESELFGYERGAFTGAHLRKPGWLEAGHQGTMFLDEVGDMSPITQAKLLRVIENKQFCRLGGNTGINVDVRFIAATNRNLEEMTSEGKFRQDLYYRLNITQVHLPPLRDRKDDIPLLLRHYIREFNSQNQKEVVQFSQEVWNSLMAYDWPGNVRELKNLLESVVVNGLGGTVCWNDLPEQFRKRIRAMASAASDEKQQLLDALFRTQWNKSKAAEELHWSRMTLYRKMQKYRILTSKSGETPQIDLH